MRLLNHEIDTSIALPEFKQKLDLVEAYYESVDRPYNNGTKTSSSSFAFTG
jgi:hypothetical protein